MTERNRTHLPRREPGCTVDIARACYDRIKLKIDRTPFGATYSEILQATAFLGGSNLQRGRNGSSIKTRNSDLLFKGSMYVSESATEAPLSLSLDLNLTRFLGRNHHRLTSPDRLRTLTQAQRLSWLTIDTENVAPRSLDNNDNFVGDVQARSGVQLCQADWLVPYVELVLAFLAGELGEAISRTPSYAARPHALAQRPPLVIALQNWRIQQLEVFWEFWSPNAVAEASDLVEIAEGISYEFDTTRYDLGRFGDGFTFGISARSYVQGVRHKLYAKLLNRLRYEIAYDRVPTQVERDIQLPPQPDRHDFIQYLGGITRAASVRADHWLDSIAEAEVRRGPLLTRSQITQFLDAVYRSTEPAHAGFIIAYLMARGAVPRSRAYPEVLSSLRTLQRQGYMIASNPGRARHTTTYQAAAPWNELIELLRGLTSHPANQPRETQI